MPAEKNRPLARRQLLQGATVIGALAALQGVDLTQATDSDAAGSSLAGAWMLQINSGGAKSADLVAFTKDGLLIDAGSVPLKAPPAGQGGSPITIGLGTWAKAMNGGFNVTFVSLGADPKGVFAATATIHAHVTLEADGNTFSGTFKVTAESNGKVQFTGAGTVKAARIKAAAM